MVDIPKLSPEQPVVYPSFRPSSPFLRFMGSLRDGIIGSDAALQEQITRIDTALADAAAADAAAAAAAADAASAAADAGAANAVASAAQADVDAVAASLSGLTTSNVPEGSRLYHTTLRARGSVSASGTVLQYDSSAGVFSVNRQTGWNAPVGSVLRLSFDPTTITLPDLAKIVAALVTDLMAGKIPSA